MTKSKNLEVKVAVFFFFTRSNFKVGGGASCNFIAVLATTREIYPKFHSFPCYYIYKLSCFIDHNNIRNISI